MFLSQVLDSGFQESIFWHKYMDRQSRIHKLSGLLSNKVDEAIQHLQSGGQKEEVVKHEYRTYNFNLDQYCAVMIPVNPVKPDGSVDFVFSFKAISPGDTKTASNTGANAVFIACYVPEIASAEHQKRFGNKAFMDNAINKVIGFLQEKHPDKKVKRGKVALTGWSGGGPTITSILTSGFHPDSVVIADGLHSTSPAVQQFAQEAAKDPSKRFVTISTGVIPQGYSSTYEASKKLSDQIGLQQSDWGGPAGSPSAAYTAGGAQWVQLYSPYDENGKPKSLEQMKHEHAQAYHWAFSGPNLSYLAGLG